MTSNGLDWQIVTRRRVRREAFWLAVIGGLMLAYGWQFLGTGRAGLYDLYVWTLRVGGLFFVALAGASLTGWRIWLLVDGLACAVVTVVFVLNAIAWLAGGYADWFQPAIFGAVFGYSAYSAIQAFRDSAAIGLWSERTDLHFDGPADLEPSPPPGRSLAGELLRRTRGDATRQAAAPPGSGDASRLDKGSPAVGEPSIGRAESPAALPRPQPKRRPEPPPAPPLRKPESASGPPPIPEAPPEGFLAALAREEEEDNDASGKT